MLARCTTATLQGLEAIPVDVEVDLGPGLPALQMVGLADTAIHESRERLRSALRNSGLRVPLTRIVVNLAPAALRKEGTGFDLPIALALLVASGQLPPERLAGLWCAAELGLDGQLRPIRGVLALAIAARRAGARALLVAEANGAEAALVHGLGVWAAASLRQALDLLTPDGPSRRSPPQLRSLPPQPPLPLRLIWPMSRARATAAGRWRSRPPESITCCWWARRAAARRCWPADCPACCPR